MASKRLTLCLSLLFAAPAVAGDFATAMKRYQEAVRVFVTEERLKAADVDPAPDAVAALAGTGDPAALEALALDSEALAKRRAAVRLEQAQKEAERDQIRGRLADETGSQRESDEKKLKELETRLEMIAEQLPLVTRLRDAVFAGVLSGIDGVADANPEAAYDRLASNFKDDMQAVAELDLAVSDREARLKTVEAAQQAASKDDEKHKLERDAAELAARLETSRVELDQRRQLKSRRIVALARLFPKLPIARRTTEVDRIRKDLDKDQEWSVRAFRAELYGALPADTVVADLLTVLRQSTREKAAQEKALEPLREAYDRAAKAYIQAVIGGHGTVPATTAASEEKTRRDLQEASKRLFGETRVAEAASRGLEAQLTLLAGTVRAAATEQVSKAMAKENDLDLRARLVLVLGTADDEKTRKELRQLAERGPEIRQRLAALDALSRLGDDGTVELALTKLLKDEDWRVRAAAMRFLVAVPRNAAVPALIESISSEVGRLVDDAEQSLTALTGQSFHGDARLWKDWWGANKDTFDVKAPKGKPAVASGAAPTGDPAHVSFYGIQTRSKRVLFVLDRSGSMNEPISDERKNDKKIDAAKQELKAALAGFVDGDHFNLITYSTDVTRWKRTMVERTDKTLRAADAYVDKEIEAVGGTNIHDALREAFQLAGIGAVDKAYEAGVDTIFFLTDGKPSVGEVIDPEEILKRVREWNRLSRIVVHTVGVGQDQDAVFLRRLAEDNGGQFAGK